MCDAGRIHTCVRAADSILFFTLTAGETSCGGMMPMLTAAIPWAGPLTSCPCDGPPSESLTAERGEPVFFFLPARGETSASASERACLVRALARFFSPRDEDHITSSCNKCYIVPIKN